MRSPPAGNAGQAGSNPRTSTAHYTSAEFTVRNFTQRSAGTRDYELCPLIGTTMPFDNPVGLMDQEYVLVHFGS